MEIKRTINAIAYENTYYLINDSHILLVDPGSDYVKIHKVISSIGKPIAAILLTHAHYDHIMSLDLVRHDFDNPPVYISAEEADWLGSPLDNLSGLPRHNDMVDVIVSPADAFFEIGKTYALNGFVFEVRQTPGHSIGGVSFIFKKDALILSGDALFRESIGRYDLPTGNKALLLDSIKTQLFTLPSHYRVYPGHGFDTTIGHEKQCNPFFIN
ncbi:MBL fold metallo-hydrolase [Streptococcus sciuri]|uniref:MBL fold metallo-hydrolase n=1 Tax=Streptococcus sciuri TaxID=2973939 RepID=A0ABT2F5S4_9STRE|nr:MBL fold metallo-hydrolase [Streptococcus sciuri]MCS4487823.1 MBL fold metallo-hydrolase [Streptococcus sciuri]